MSLNFKITGDDSDLNQKLANVRANIKGTSDVATKEGEKMDRMFKNLAIGAASFFSIQQAGNFIKQMATVRGEFQQLEVAFNTMLGSKEASMALMDQMVETAAKTPFDLQGVASGAKQLLAYGTAAEDVNETLIMLGNIAAGLSIPLGDLVYLYGTTQVQGRLFTMNVRQFMGRGIPIVQELANVLGKSTDEINAMVTAGEIGFPIVQKAIQNMTSEGGKFYNLMQEQSKTIAGQIGNLKDAIDVAFNEMGRRNEETISNVISTATVAVENYEKIGKVIGDLVLAYGSYKAAVIAMAAVRKVQNFTENIRLMSMFRKELGLATAAQQAFNLKVMANPYVAAATAVIALGIAVAKLAKEYDKLHYSSREAEKMIKESAESARKEHNADIIALSKLKGQLEGCEKGTAEWVKVRDEIVSKYGQYDENLQAEIDKVGDLSASYEKLAESLKNFYSRKAFEEFLSKHQQMETEVINENLEKIAKKLNIDKSAEGAALYGRIQQALLGDGTLSKNLQAEISNLGMNVGGAVWNAIHNVWEARNVYSTAEQKAKEAFGIVDKKVQNIDQEKVGSETAQQVVNDLKQLIIKIEEAKVKINELRLQSQKGLTDELRKSIESAEAELKSLTDDYSLMTGTSYTSKATSIVDPNFIINTKEIFGRAIEAVKEQIKEANADGSLSLVQINEEAIMTMSDNFNEYLAMFGNYQEKKLAIQNIYNKRIAESSDAGERTLLKAQMEAELKNLAKDNLGEIAEKGRIATESIYTLADTMFLLADATGNENLKNTSTLLGDVGDVMNATMQGLGTGGIAGAVASGGVALIMKAVEDIAKRKKDILEVKKATQDFLNELNMLSLSLNEAYYDSIFGTTSIMKAADAYKIGMNALREFNTYLNSNIINMSIKTKDRLGFRRDEYSSLKDYAPELWEKGQFNVDNAEAFLKTNTQITEEQKEQIRHAIDLKNAYDEAIKVIDEQLSGWLGNMADNLADTLWDSVVNGGEDAWTQWQNIGSEAIANIGKQMISELIMDSYLNSFQDKLRSAYSQSDPASAVANITAEIVNGLPAVMQSATDAALMFKDKMEAEGIDLTGESTRTASSKGLAQASQDSIDELNGRFTVIQGHTFEINGNVRDLRINSDVIMNNVAEIAVNTRRLEGIEINLSALNKNVDDIMLKGIAIRN